jgi:ComF family protein
MFLLDHLIDQVGHCLAPSRCAACDSSVPTHCVMCKPCAETVEEVLPTNDAWHLAYGYYGGALATSIHRFKYQERPDLARPLGFLLAEAAQPLLTTDVDWLVPIPLARTRLVERGYNQTTLLAQQVSKQLSIPIYTHALFKPQHQGRQAERTMEQRHQATRGIFSTNKRLNYQGKRVVIIDDVITTGATIHEAQRELERAGATVVAGLALALTPKYIPQRLSHKCS